MPDEKWTLLLGLPLIALLSAMAWRRGQALITRIREEREEIGRNPQDPYRALAMLMAEKEQGQKKKRGCGNG